MGLLLVGDVDDAGCGVLHKLCAWTTSTLIGIGASLTMSRALVADSVVWSAVALKLVALPALIIISAVYIGITGAALGVIALMFASPTAAAAFVMAKSMNADSRLTADVIALSTLGSGVTVTTIIYVLNLSGLL